MVVKKQKQRVDIEQTIAGAAIFFVLYVSIAILSFVNGKIVLAISWSVLIPALAWWFVTKKK